MPKYEFFGPTGEKFEIDAPAGVSVAQARVFFQQQLSTGSLTNLPVGGTLDAASQAKNKFSSLATGLAGLTKALPQGVIDAADYVKQGFAGVKVGSINTAQVTGLLAQAEAVSGQSVAELTNNGVGKFAISPEQLETAGLIKPGTVQQFLSNSNNAASVLNSPSIWTGREGVNNVQSLLADPGLQNRVQQQVMNSSLAELQKLGVVNGTETPTELAPFVQTATKFGVETAAAWAKGQAPADLINSINGVAKGAQYAVNFVNDKVPDVLASGARLGGFTGTVDRGLLDATLGLIVDNPKIPLPNFGQGLMTSSRDEDLEYRGDDEIVWDRVNQERRRRGLPGLAEINIPRPINTT